MLLFVLIVLLLTRRRWTYGYWNDCYGYAPWRPYGPYRPWMPYGAYSPYNPYGYGYGWQQPYAYGAPGSYYRRPWW